MSVVDEVLYRGFLHRVWQSTTQGRVTKVSLPNVKTVGRTAFFRARKLREFDFSNVETIRGQGFYETGLTSVNAPNLTTFENAAFSLSKVGSDPSYPQGFYFPKLTVIPPSTFHNAKLTYVKVSEQMPLVTTIESNAFLQNEIRSVDITGVTAVRSSAFSNQSTTNGGQSRFAKCNRCSRNCVLQ